MDISTAYGLAAGTRRYLLSTQPLSPSKQRSMARWSNSRLMPFGSTKPWRQRTEHERQRLIQSPPFYPKHGSRGGELQLASDHAVGGFRSECPGTLPEATPANRRHLLSAVAPLRPHGCLARLRLDRVGASQVGSSALPRPLSASASLLGLLRRVRPQVGQPRDCAGGGPQHRRL